MDEWDLNDPKAEVRLRARFEMNPRSCATPTSRTSAEDCPTCPPTAGSRKRGTFALAKPATGTTTCRALERKNGLPWGPVGDRLRRDPPGGPLEGGVAGPHRQREGTPARAWRSIWWPCRIPATDIALLYPATPTASPASTTSRAGPSTRRGRVSPWFPRRLPRQGHVIAAQDRGRFRGSGLTSPS